MTQPIEFNWQDHSLFTAMVLSSLIVIIYYAYKKTSSLADYIWGSGQLGVFPLSMSLIATCLSSIVFSYSNEVYQYGAHITLDTLAVILVGIMCWLQVPVLYPLKLISLNEYAAMRFNNTVKTVMSINILIYMNFHATLVSYSTSLFVSQISGLGLMTCFAVITTSCSILTAIGGFKGVVWTDTLQAGAMFLSVIFLVVMGMIEAGGIERVYQSALDGGRLDFDWTLDVTKRLTVWSAILGLTTQRISRNSLFTPALYQRYAALQSLGQAKRTLLIHTAGMFIIASSTYLTGFVMYALFQNCDPVLSGQANKYDHILPYFIQFIGNRTRIARSVYIVGFISAAISTLTAVMNTFAVTVYDDVLKRRFNKCDNRTKGKRLIQLVVLVMLVNCIILVRLLEKLGNVADLMAMLTVPATLYSSILFIGLFIPWIGPNGVLWGGIISMISMFGIIIGSKVSYAQGLIKHPIKQMRIDQCSFNVTSINTTSLFDTDDGEAFLLFRVSTFLHTVMCFVLVLFLATVITLLTGCNDLRQLDERLISPLLRRFIPSRDNDKEAVPLKRQEEGDGKIPRVLAKNNKNSLPAF